MHLSKYRRAERSRGSRRDPSRSVRTRAEERSDELLELAIEKAEAFAKSQVGKTLDVLVEEENPPSGWSDNYLHVTLESREPVAHNTIQTAIIQAATGKRELIGRL